MGIVISIHDIPADRHAALKGRFRNFGKLSFPNVTAVGTGSRAEYWPEHVALTLFAFELVRYRMPQSAVAQGLTKHRDTVLDAVGDAGRRIVSGTAGKPILLTVVSNALLEDAKRPELADVSFVRAGDEGTSSASHWTIDVVRLVELAVSAAGRTDEPLDAGFFARITTASSA